MSKGRAKSLNEMTKLAESFVTNYFRKRTVIAGSIRRECAEVNDIDILTNDSISAIKSRIEKSKESNPVGFSVQIVNFGNKKIDIVYNGVQINIYHSKLSQWGAMLMFLTGPGRYNIWYRMKAKKLGLILNQYGLWDADGNSIAGRTETGIYEALGKKWKEPRLRGI